MIEDKRALNYIKAHFSSTILDVTSNLFLKRGQSLSIDIMNQSAIEAVLRLKYMFGVSVDTLRIIDMFLSQIELDILEKIQPANIIIQGRENDNLKFPSRLRLLELKVSECACLAAKEISVDYLVLQLDRGFKGFSLGQVHVNRQLEVRTRQFVGASERISLSNLNPKARLILNSSILSSNNFKEFLNVKHSNKYIEFSQYEKDMPLSLQDSILQYKEILRYYPCFNEINGNERLAKFVGLV